VIEQTRIDIYIYNQSYNQQIPTIGNGDFTPSYGKLNRENGDQSVDGI
jgi:hypothetical protein